MTEVDKITFEEEVLKAKGFVLVDFWSPKCEPCKELMPGIAVLAEKYQGKAKFCKLDAAANKRLSISQKVLGLPTIVIYKDGEKAAEFSKDFAIEDVEAKLKELTS